MTIAVTIFLRQTICENRIPFELKLNAPDDETAVAIEKGRKNACDKTAKGYACTDDLKLALNLS